MSKVSDVSALFIDPMGPYPSLVEDWYDVYRDAFTFTGSNPVICHPPCETWGKFRNFPTRMNKPKDDGGAFEFCLSVVRRNRGVIEHPYGSLAFRRFNLASCGVGKVIEFYQGTYGHRAPKRTLLYVVGFDLDIDTSVSLKPGRVELMTSSARHYTPRPLAELLVRSMSKGQL